MYTRPPLSSGVHSRFEKKVHSDAVDSKIRREREISEMVCDNSKAFILYQSTCIVSIVPMMVLHFAPS